MSRVLRRKLLRDLYSRKGSILALLLIVAVGVGCYVGMAGAWRDMDGSRHRYYRDYQLFDFSVDCKRAPEWAVQDIVHWDNVREVRGRVSLAVLVEVPGVEEPISGRVISMPEVRRPVLNDILLRTGTYFSGESDKEAILNEAFAQANSLGPGSRIKVKLLDQQHELLVIGTAMSPEFVYLFPEGGGLAPDPARFGVMYLPDRFLQQSCNLEGSYNQIIGLVYDDSPPILTETLDLIEEDLDAFGVTHATAARDQPSVRFLHDELEGLKVTAMVIPGLFLGVAALILNVMMGRLVGEQRSVIGTLKALGHSHGAVRRHYVTYGLVIGAAGGLVGMLVGTLLQIGMVGIYRQFYNLPGFIVHVYPDLFFHGFMISVFFAVLGTLKGVRSASRLEPAEAMRPPPPEKGGKVPPERIGVLWRRLSFRWKMILRAVFRNPFRSTVTIFAAAISMGLVFMTFANLDALDYLMAYEFEKIAHQDVTVSLRDPKDDRATVEIGDLPSISQAEPQLTVVCDLSNGVHQKRAGVTGLPLNNRLYTPLNAAGVPITVPDAGLVLSKKLAEILRASVGDRVRLRPLIGRRQVVTAPVSAVVDSFLGLSAYAGLDYLSRLLGETESANLLLGTRFTGASTEAFLREVKRRPAVVGITERRRALTQLDESFGENMGTMISIMVLFAGLIAFGSVLNATLVSLSERQREVGTLRVLGYTPIQVTRIFSGESFLLNSVGIVAGIFLGVGFSHLLATAYNTELYRFPVVIRPQTMLVSAVLMAAFVTAAQIIVYRLVRGLDWLEVFKIKE